MSSASSAPVSAGLRAARRISAQSRRGTPLHQQTNWRKLKNVAARQKRIRSNRPRREIGANIGWNAVVTFCSLQEKQARRWAPLRKGQ